MLGKKNIINIKNSIKKGAMFGLDARIALAVLAIISFSIATVGSKKKLKDSREVLSYDLQAWENSFLKHWSSLRTSGYYTTSNGTEKLTNVTSATHVAGFNGSYNDTSVYFDFAAANKGTTTFTARPDFTHVPTGQLYNAGYISGDTNYPGLTNMPIVAFYNYKDAYYSAPTSTNYLGKVLADAKYRIFMSLYGMTQDYGKGLFSSLTYSDAVQMGVNTLAISTKRDPMSLGLEMYFIIELNLDDYAPTDYVVHTILYSQGPNSTRDNILPTTIEQLRAFNFNTSTDDVFYHFSTKQSYLDAKLENMRRLEEIKEAALNKAEMNYVERMSLCATEATVSASCDINSDTEYTSADETLLLDYNPFLKSSLDTSSANYLDNTNTYSQTTTAAQTFLSTHLAMPEYLAYDLFGNIINYQSNVGLRTTAPFTMEVWY